uniref:Uncharacterized protein n=1 Tax=Arundo donax TaxID=35708 RepID=A0A0A9CNX0_ARUDO
MILPTLGFRHMKFCLELNLFLK